MTGQWPFLFVKGIEPLGRGPHEFIEEQVERTPDAPALTVGSEQISYSELNARANRMSRFLLNKESYPRLWSGYVSIVRSTRS